MFSRLSIVSRIALLQTVIVVAVIMSSTVALRLTGRGKHESEAMRAISEDLYQPGTLAKWLRAHGWTLLALPVLTVAAGHMLARRRGEPANDVAAIGASLAVLLLVIGICATIQPFGQKFGLFIKSSVPEQPTEQPPPPK